MNDEYTVGVIVRDSDIRDLIALNLRFEAYTTNNFDNLKSFLNSGKESGLLILDVCGEREPRVLVQSVREKCGKKFPVLLLTDRGTPSVEGEREIIIESSQGRKRFDAAELISIVKELFASNQEGSLRHPLTGLPSGAAVERHINGLIAGVSDFALISTDLDNMKAFNQRFGYSHGDSLLRYTVKLIEGILKGYPNKLNFVGHRGEDDFVITSSCEDAQAIGEKIVDEFDSMIGGLFDEEDIERGYFVVNDRRGNEVKFPLTTLSVVIVYTEGRQFYHPAELFDISDEIMAEVKSRGINQSYCAIEKKNNKTEKTGWLNFGNIEEI